MCYGGGCLVGRGVGGGVGKAYAVSCQQRHGVCLQCPDAGARGSVRAPAGSAGVAVMPARLPRVMRRGAGEGPPSFPVAARSLAGYCRKAAAAVRVQCVTVW